VQTLQNPEARRRTVIAALIALAVIAVLVIAIRSDGDGGSEPDSDSGDQQGEVQEPQGPELGSLAVAAYQCPALSSPDTDCIAAGAIDLTAFSLTTPDGQTLTLENATRGEDGGYQWLNIPIGTYELLAENVAGPPGMSIRNVAGAAEPIDGGWSIANADPNQPAVVQILYTTGEGSPAAG
jgi:hypothetical protein